MANIWYYTCQLSAFQFVSTFFFHQFRCCGVDSYRDWSDVSELSLYQTARYPGFASFVKLGRNVTSSNRGAGERKVFRVPASCCEYVAPSDNSNHPNVVSWSNCYASVESAEEVLLHNTLNLYPRTLFDNTVLHNSQVSRGGRKYFSGCYTKLQKSLGQYKLLCEATNITVSAMVVSYVTLIFFR